MKGIVGSLIAALALSQSQSIAAKTVESAVGADEAALAGALGRCFVLKSTGQD